jgi:CDP-diacylglycerol--glycerol-3-phosphate 3-phosphatidyltransferase
MIWNAPNALTLLRLVLIPLFVAAYYLPYDSANWIAAILFIIAGATDWLDGFLARQLKQQSAFGAFLDPVVDKLMVVAALVMLLADPEIMQNADIARRVLNVQIFTVAVLVIVGREIAVSALREWMAEYGKRSRVAVSFVGKFKTTSQMVAIAFLLWRDPIGGWSMLRIGEILLYIAAAITLWSMFIYIRLAWVDLVRPQSKRDPEQRRSPSP